MPPVVVLQVELGSPDSAAPNQGQVHVTVECSSCASPEFKGRGGEDWGIELAQALEAALLGSPASGGGPGLHTALMFGWFGGAGLYGGSHLGA